jgi:hypothetical protein
MGETLTETEGMLTYGEEICFVIYGQPGQESCRRC